MRKTRLILNQSSFFQNSKKFGFLIEFPFFREYFFFATFKKAPIRSLFCHYARSLAKKAANVWKYQFSVYRYFYNQYLSVLVRCSVASVSIVEAMAALGVFGVHFKPKTSVFGVTTCKRRRITKIRVLEKTWFMVWMFIWNGFQLEYLF